MPTASNSVPSVSWNVALLAQFPGAHRRAANPKCNQWIQPAPTPNGETMKNPPLPLNDKWDRDIRKARQACGSEALPGNVHQSEQQSWEHQLYLPRKCTTQSLHDSSGRKVQVRRVDNMVEDRYE
uniref:Uncharacterized protein n=1 Tax=Knipowitschia caucasica TaxID=637954 RepID=A0AAV2KUE9_KNICA